METQPVIKRSRLKQLLALFMFLIIGGLGTMPLLCIGGEVAARYKTLLFVFIFSRLSWCIYKRTFRYLDCFVYLVISVGFDMWIDSHF